MYPSNRFSTNLLSLQGLRLLVIDNHVDSCDLIAMLLQPYGVEVKAAFLAQQALKLIVQWQPDILVSEIVLPEKDGFALIQQVRTQAGKWGEGVPIIAVTACVTEEIRQRALSCGFDQWLTKPLDFDAFIAALASAVTRPHPSSAVFSAIGTVPTCQIVQQILDQVLTSGSVLAGVI